MRGGVKGGVFLPKSDRRGEYGGSNLGTGKFSTPPLTGGDYFEYSHPQGGSRGGPLVRPVLSGAEPSPFVKGILPCKMSAAGEIFAVLERY